MDNRSEEHLFKTRTTEIEACSSYTALKMNLPSYVSTIPNRLLRQSLKIDTGLIHYSPQIPINSSGLVRIRAEDNRLVGEDKLQAEFVIPVTCKCTLEFYGNSFASANEERCPWSVKYRLEDSNIKPNIKFCKIKIQLKITSEKDPDTIKFRPPKINILSPHHSEKDVDYWHVGPKEKQRAICRTTSMTTMKRFAPQLLPGQTYQQHRASISECKANAKPDEEQEQTTTITPPTTASTSAQTTQNSTTTTSAPSKQKDATNKAEITMNHNEFAAVIRETVKATPTHPTIQTKRL